jgi:hypothetical protein
MEIGKITGISSALLLVSLAPEENQASMKQKSE